MKKEKIINIIFFIVTFFIILITSFSQPVTILDEMWNYNIARNIANGLIPYKDISMITSPLLSMIVAIFIKIFDEIIVTRILNAIVLTLILYFLYKILIKLKINKYVSYCAISIILFYERVLYTLDYNIVVILIGVIITYLDLINIDKSENKNRYNFFIGILVGISICIKQSIGILLLIASIIYNIKNNEFIKKSLIRIIGAMVPIVVLLIYLVINHAIYDFFDYCVLGIQTFDNKVSYIELFKDKSYFVKIFSIIIPITYIICILKKEKNREMKTLMVYGLAMYAMVYPIADNHHFLVGALPNIILSIYVIYFLIKKHFSLENVKLVKIIKTCLRSFYNSYNARISNNQFQVIPK